MLEYKGKVDEKAGNRPYCNHQEFVLKISLPKSHQSVQYLKSEFSKLIQKEELSEKDHLKYVKYFLDVSLHKISLSKIFRSSN